MITDRHKYAFITLYFLSLQLICLAATESVPDYSNLDDSSNTEKPTTTATLTHEQPQQNEVNTLSDAATVHAFNQRVDYNNEWRPLGHGDPLKNDPTYDYSPPALDRVRYWAENTNSNKSGSSSTGTTAEKDALQKQKQQLPLDVLKNKSQSEILLLGVSSERQRSHFHGGEAPLLQPKYTNIRRSYYAQQHMPPTHLMPPPPHMQMQMIQQQMLKHMPNAAASEYRQHNAGMLLNYMPHASGASATVASTPTYNAKAQYHTANTVGGTPAWMQTSTPPRMSVMYQNEPHTQATLQHYTFTRPHMTGAAGSTSTTQNVAYSPNAIHHTPYKSMSSYTGGAKPQRKPWLHELLQKELIAKPVKPTMPATKYLMGNTKPQHAIGISTTYKPVVFVSAPPTLSTPSWGTTTTKQNTHSYDVYITPTPKPMTMAATPPTPTPTPTPTPINSGLRPIYSTPAASTTTSKATTTTTTTTTTRSTTTPPPSNRLLIPTMSNLAQRPTVAPIELTTDALFKHYKQPQKPLVGPMYLIIEGHSKVKTYGQNELDPHQPKIVPIIPKREPIVRVADPNEAQRGTVETYQVKHLHTKLSEITTPMPTTRTTTKTTTKPTAKVTTLKPMPVKLSVSTPKPHTTPPTTMRTTTTTTKASTAKPTISTTTTTTTTTTSVRPVTLGVRDKPVAAAETAPTGMQSLLNLLDIFASNTNADEPPPSYAHTGNTVLRPVSHTPAATQPEPRIGISADRIDSNLDEDYEVEDESMSEFVTTEPPPRGLRQIFDYDELPEMRHKQLDATIDEKPETDNEQESEEAAQESAETAPSTVTANKETAEDGPETNDEQDVEDDDDNDDDDDETHKLLKRIDNFVDAVDSNEDEIDDDENIYESLVNLDSDEDLETAVDEQRKQHA